MLHERNWRVSLHVLEFRHPPIFPWILAATPGFQSLHDLSRQTTGSPCSLLGSFLVYFSIFIGLKMSGRPDLSSTVVDNSYWRDVTFNLILSFSSLSITYCRWWRRAWWKWKWNLMEVSRLRSGRLSNNKKKLPIQCSIDLWVLVESYSRTRWLDKLRPAGTPHRWMGRGARWHLSWPLADTTAQKKNLTTFLDSCMSSLLLSMLFFSVSFKRETPRTLFVILTQGPCSQIFIRRHCRRKE